ncbi:PAP2 superfamily [Nakaseomyces glabratus]|nr:Long-chain base-1-phosphate phosphatase [Nakaseomyces glabratus]
MSVAATLIEKADLSIEDSNGCNAAKHHLSDPGNHPAEHFKKKMSPLRFKMRQFLTRYTDHQSETLANIQHTLRNPVLDVYFKYSALMGAHTFYIIALPIPIWFGHWELTRDLVYIFGYSIYLSGFLKDYWCLPRPRSPPVERITLSKYTTREYGAPSSHTANATGVSAYFLWRIWVESNFTLTSKALLSIGVMFYYLTLVVGRVYCGMHGLLDLYSGALVGLACFMGRIGFDYLFPTFKASEYNWVPVLSVIVSLFLLYKHIKPVDECPCFEDSVAFIGVVSGLDCSNWLIAKFNLNLVCSFIDFEPKNCLHILARLLVGVLTVIVWKYVISKPLVYFTLVKLVRLKDERKDYHERHEITKLAAECAEHIGVPNIELLGRFIIYAGVPSTVILVCPVIFKVLQL